MARLMDGRCVYPAPTSSRLCQLEREKGTSNRGWVMCGGGVDCPQGSDHDRPWFEKQQDDEEHSEKRRLKKKRKETRLSFHRVCEEHQRKRERVSE